MYAGNSSLLIPELMEARVVAHRSADLSVWGWLISTMIRAFPLGLSLTDMGFTVMEAKSQCSSTSSFVRGPQARSSSSHCCRLSTSLSPYWLTFPVLVD